MEQKRMNKVTKPYLPPEIITNILLRLPVKSLIRFQYVCKNWKGLVQSPLFITDHLHHSANQSSLLFRNINRFTNDDRLCMINQGLDFSEIQKPPFLDVGESAEWTVVSSSNGLICFELKSYRSRIYLWNPATKETLKVPRALRQYRRCSYYPPGFGFCSTLNDYKIVRLFLSSDYLIHRVEVFSLRKGSWKDVDAGITKGVFQIMHNSISCNGVVFWLAKLTDKFGNHYHASIVSFDLTAEEFTVIEMPTLSVESFHCHTLTVFEDKIAMFYTRENENSDYSIDLWVMEGLIWIKKSTITPYPSFLQPNAIWRDQLVSTNNEDINLECVALFNLLTHEIKFPMKYHSLSNFWVSYSFSSYVESLVPVGNIRLKNIKLKDGLSRRLKYASIHCEHILSESYYMLMGMFMGFCAGCLSF